MTESFFRSSTERSVEERKKPLSIRTGCEPGVNVWPCILHRPTSRHHANMAYLHLQKELILAADLRHDTLRLAGRRDMIGERDHIEQVRAYTTQVHPLATNDHLPLYEPVLPVELLNQLQISCPGHGDEIGDPGVHGVPRFHVTRVIQVIPQRQIGTDIVLDRLARLSSVIDSLAWHRSPR